MEIPIAKVTHYFNRIGVAVLELAGELKVGDTLLILGYTTDITQKVESLEIDHHKVLAAGAGNEVALKVEEPVRQGDEVFRLVEYQGGPENLSLWIMLHNTLEAILPHYEPVFDRFLSYYGLDNRMLGVLLAALTFDPEIISSERLQVRGPYTAAHAYQARLDALAEKGFLVEALPGEFRLTINGKRRVRRLVDEARAVMAKADPLPPEKSQRLAVLLARLAQSSLDTPPPPDTGSIRQSWKLMPEPEPPLPFIEQSISCLNGYRDDAHLAAWQPGGLSAAALESLTLLWRGEATSLDGICQKLGSRGYSPQVYVEALAELRSRAFIKGLDSALALTGPGKAFRNKVEEETNRYFFAPWSCLDSEERNELTRLLIRLQTGLRGKP